MTDTQLQCFQMIANTESFSQAAMHLYISQSAVSKHIATLQSELGATLFLHKNRKAVLSPAGEILLQYCNEMSASQLSMLHKLQELREHNFSGIIRIGCRPSWNVKCFSDILSEKVSEIYPRITLEFVGFEAGGPITMLNDGAIDLAFVYDVEPVNYASVAFRPLVQLDTYLLYSTTLFEPGARLTPLDFKDMDFLILETPAAHLIAKHMKHRFETLGFTPHFREMRSLSNVLMEVTQQRGIAPLDSWEQCLKIDDFDKLSLNLPLEVRTVYLTRTVASVKSTYNNEIATFISTLSPELKKNAPEYV